MIDVRDLHVTLGKRPILRGISLEVRRGDTVALVGPNGAGKTTAIRAIAGLVRYDGAITIGGVDAARDPVRAKARLGFMPQAPAFLEETPRGALAFLAAIRSADRRAIDPLLDRVGLLPHARRRIADFSTGMRQRLALAAALVGDPDVLLLDEPTASLDLRGQREFVDLLRGLEQEGKTVLLSSHRAEEVRALARRLVVLEEGRIVAEGPVDDVAEAFFGGPALVPEEVTPCA
jgi:ABC-type multidrug transport system ATPase subunit